MIRLLRSGLAVAALGLALCSVAPAYYHYIHFASASGPFIPLPEKYDLTALRNETVYYFISEQGPTELAPGDSFAGLVSQLRFAASAWNAVPSSDLRIAFGGFESTSTTQNAPGIDIVFDDDIPPGLAALGGVTSIASPIISEDGTGFVPITRGIVKIRRDLHDSPSFGERYFLTLVHEFGHSLGLQHTLTSAVMSTEITRATTRSKPLADDDVAAVSVLYPTARFLATTATITGRVAMNGRGVNLASVVAISPNGPSIGTLTNPDGSYVLRGIPPGPYYVYVHPLPVALNGENFPANIKPPQDADGNLIGASASFDTVFYPGTRDPSAAATMFLHAAGVKEGIDFSVHGRKTSAVSSVTTYGYYGRTAVHPAPVLGTGTGSTLVAAGLGLVPAPNVIAPGLNVRVLGESGATVRAGSVKYYTYPYIRFDVAPSFGWAPGFRHLLFSTTDDLYVLPSGLVLVSNEGPTISDVSPADDGNGGPAVLITGTTFNETTRVFFDGTQANILHGDEKSLLVSVPPALGGHRANIVALNGDGQSSLFTQPSGGPAYTYPDSDAPLLSISPAVLPAGSESMVEITGVNTTFGGRTVIGFGSSDIAVRQVWATGAGKLLANVSVNLGAPVTQTSLTVATGLQIATSPLAFSISPAPAHVTTLIPPARNATTATQGVYPGSKAILAVANLPSDTTGLILTVSDEPVKIFSQGDGAITFEVPSTLPLGPAVVKLQLPGGNPVLPVVMNIDPPPPAILAIYSDTGVVADASHPARPGSILRLKVARLPDGITSVDPANVKIEVGGMVLSAFSLSVDQDGTLVQVSLPAELTPGEAVPVVIVYNGITSDPVAVPVK